MVDRIIATAEIEEVLSDSRISDQEIARLVDYIEDNYTRKDGEE